MAATESALERKRLGAWYTPAHIVDLVVERTITPSMVDTVKAERRALRVLDPACGDGRFLAAARARVDMLGAGAHITGVDVDEAALRMAASVLRADAQLLRDDALRRDWGDERFDVVLGNPPFLSQLAAATTRGGASRHGGGPYADAAAEFLALAVRLADPDGGRVGLVLPQSILASRDAGPVRSVVDGLATMAWSWWSPRRHFDADVRVCALGFERGAPAVDAPPWCDVVTAELGVPSLPPLHTNGTLGDRAVTRANFRDEYYGLVPAVSDAGDGPALVTSGLIDHAACHWGTRPVRFAKRNYIAPRVALDRLDPPTRSWADRMLVPKVLVANQTRTIEAVVDPTGAWLPSVPVVTCLPRDAAFLWEVAAVLTSPVAS
ncbi:MAG TPA: N-6 DNA methylase, partial [Ilumatobacteraceae bacterium]